MLKSAQLDYSQHNAKTCQPLHQRGGAGAGPHRYTAEREGLMRFIGGVAVATLMAALPPSVRAQNAADAVALGMATYQPGAPVALRGYLASAGSFLYQAARVENLTPAPIASVTFLVLITTGERTHVTTMTSAAEDLGLQPGRTEDVAVKLLPVEQLERLRQSLRPEQWSSLKVVLGVQAVRWADGARWELTLPDDARDFSRGGGTVTPAAVLR